MVIVKLGLQNLSCLDKPTKGQSIVESMTVNPYFPAGETGTLLTDLGNASTALRDRNETAENGTSAQRAAARQSEKDWNGVYSEVASYVDGKAIADPANAEAMVLSAGFEVHKKPVPAPVPEPAQNFLAVFTGNPGTVRLTWKGVKYARSYKVYMTETPETEGSWTLLDSVAGRKMLVEGLVSGKRYYFCSQTV